MGSAAKGKKKRPTRLADHLGTYTLKPNEKIQVQMMLGRRGDGRRTEIQRPSIKRATP